MKVLKKKSLKNLNIQTIGKLQSQYLNGGNEGGGQENIIIVWPAVVGTGG